MEREMRRGVGRLEEETKTDQRREIETEKLLRFVWAGGGKMSRELFPLMIPVNRPVHPIPWRRPRTAIARPRVLIGHAAPHLYKAYAGPHPL